MTGISHHHHNATNVNKFTVVDFENITHKICGNCSPNVPGKSKIFEMCLVDFLPDPIVSGRPPTPITK